eukprot:gene509-903_t
MALSISISALQTILVEVLSSSDDHHQEDEDHEEEAEEEEEEEEEIAILSGKTVHFYEGGATFEDDVVILGRPGKTYNLSVFADHHEEVKVTVALKPCAAGEKELADDHSGNARCIECSPGSITILAGSSECTDCDVSGIECLGGDRREARPRGPQAELAAAAEARAEGGKVLGPTLVMFRSHLTAMMYLVANWTSFAGLPLGFLINWRCTAHYLFDTETDSFYPEFHTKLVSPWLCIVFLGGPAMINNRRYNRLKEQHRLLRYSSESWPHEGGEDHGAAAETESSFRDMEMEAQLYHCKAVKDTCMAILLFLLQFLYPTVGKSVFDIYHCSTVNLTSLDNKQLWLVPNRSIQCFESVTWKWNAFFSIMIILSYILALPIGMFVMLKFFKMKKRYHVNCSKEVLAELPQHMTFFTRALNHHDGTEHGAIETTVHCFNSEVTIEQNLMHIAVGSLKFSVSPVYSILVQDDGSRLEYHLSMLDSPEVGAMFGQYYKAFEPCCYYWNCIVLVRRLAQVGGVVLWSIFSPDTTLLYALGICIIAAVLQAHFAPFEEKVADEMELVIEMYLLVILFTFIVKDTVIDSEWDEDAQEDWSGADNTFLIALHIGLGSYLLWVILPALKASIPSLVPVLKKRMTRISGKGRAAKRRSEGGEDKHSRGEEMRKRKRSGKMSRPVEHERALGKGRESAGGKRINEMPILMSVNDPKFRHTALQSDAQAERCIVMEPKDSMKYEYEYEGPNDEIMFNNPLSNEPDMEFVYASDVEHGTLVELANTSMTELPELENVTDSEDTPLVKKVREIEWELATAVKSSGMAALETQDSIEHLGYESSYTDGLKVNHRLMQLKEAKEAIENVISRCLMLEDGNGEYSSAESDFDDLFDRSKSRECSSTDLNNLCDKSDPSSLLTY